MVMIKQEIRSKYGIVALLETILGKVILGIKIKEDVFYINSNPYHYYGTMMEVASVLDNEEETSELHLLLSMTK